MKRTLYYITRGSLVFFVIAIILYLIASFRFLDINPAHWSPDSRTGLSVMFIIALIVAWISTFFMSMDESK